MVHWNTLLIKSAFPCIVYDSVVILNKQSWKMNVTVGCRQKWHYFIHLNENVQRQRYNSFFLLNIHICRGRFIIQPRKPNIEYFFIIALEIENWELKTDEVKRGALSINIFPSRKHNVFYSPCFTSSSYKSACAYRIRILSRSSE